MRLIKIQLINFKCFANHFINFKETTIIIGENNAGKSTVVEALRVLGLACARLKSIPVYHYRPEWLNNVPMKHKGVNVSSKQIDVELESVFNRYNEPPAIIRAYFDEEVSVEIYINNEDQIFAMIYKNETIMTAREKAINSGLPNVFVLPQIIPLVKEEKLYTEKTLLNNRFSKRISRNFRNNLLQTQGTEQFKCFESIIEETWGGIKIHGIYLDDIVITLQIRERDFVTEIYNMGHGVQMWLQTMWFITQVDDDGIIVLDEPDVYMHADLQRRLIRLLKNRFNQTIIATHSIEIMAEVKPQNILITNRKKNESIFADDYPVLQTAITSMGSIHNIDLARLLSNKKYLFIEGDDKAILKILYDKLFPDADIPLDHIANVTTGGWGSWESQKLTAKEMMNKMKGLKIYFLYDRDYFPDEIINERKNDAIASGINLYILVKKEIENYLVVPKVISRVIFESQRQNSFEDIERFIIQKVDAFCEEKKEYVLDKLIDEAKKTPMHKKKSIPTLKQELRPCFDKKWNTFEGRSGLVSGKELISRLSEECKKEFGKSFGENQIASAMRADDIPYDIKTFLKAIKDGNNLSGNYE